MSSYLTFALDSRDLERRQRLKSMRDPCRSASLANVEGLCA
jgi:hypothetical protein